MIRPALMKIAGFISEREEEISRKYSLEPAVKRRWHSVARARKCSSLTRVDEGRDYIYRIQSAETIMTALSAQER